MTTIIDGSAVNYVYWIHHPEHTDIFSQGYVGITKRFKRRVWEHSKLTTNPHLKYAIKKYGWDNLVKEKVIAAKEDYCLEMEAKLRPTQGIGWNVVVGGGKPPKQTKGFAKGSIPWNKGKTISEETKKKIAEATRIQMQDPARKEINRQLLLGKPSLRKRASN